MEENDSKPFFGEPIQIYGNTLHFTSWKYVRQGGFKWRIKDGSEISTTGDNSTLFGGDGDIPASFETVSMPQGIRLSAQKAEKIPFQSPKDFSVATLIRDEGIYKAWSYFTPKQEIGLSSKNSILIGHNIYVTYAESKDAFFWNKPELEIHEYQGNDRNNIVFRGDLDGSIRGFHGGSIFIDPTTDTEKYKMIYLGFATEEELKSFEKKYPNETDNLAVRRNPKNSETIDVVYALFGAVSPDGTHWKTIQEPLTIHYSDTQQTCYYDVVQKRYIAYVRMWQNDFQAPGMFHRYPKNWIEIGRRSIGRAVGKNFFHFSKPEIVIAPGADMKPSHVWYSNCKTTLPDSPDQHVMFPWCWEREWDGGHTWLFSSADGLGWSQVPGGPVVECGSPGEPDGMYIGCSPNLVSLPDGKWALPYQAHPIPHKYPGRNLEERKGLFPNIPVISGYACWTKGRLVALECPEEGNFSTIGLMAPTSKIRLNASVLPTGYIKIGVSFLSGDMIPGRTLDDTDRIIGDGIELPVTWNGEYDLNNRGEPIILHFRLKQTKLFAVEFY